MAISGSESQTSTSKMLPQVEVECVKCDCCGFTEECTPAYILRLRQKYKGHWLCGLCIEAVKDEAIRSETLISAEEALSRHISFCREFRSSSALKKTEHPIFAMGRVLRRSLDSPTPSRSNSIGSLPVVKGVRTSALVRSESCFSSFSRSCS